MSDTMTTRPVLVGADGSEGALHGVRWAAHEAERLHTGLKIVHVTPGYSAGSPALPIVPEGTLRSYGASVLEKASSEAQEACPDLQIEVDLLTGGRVSGLVHAAEGAALLVLATEGKNLAERVWTGPTVTGVTSRATCPVVVVPSGPEDRKSAPSTHGRVLVGYKSSHHAPEMFTAAFALARSLSAEVVVLHAWQMASGYDDVVANRVAREEFGQEQTKLIESLLHDLRELNPEVPVRIDVVHGQPAHALVAASSEADRLVIQRPAHGGMFHHLGAVARAVLREAHCPVEVLAPVGSSRDDHERVLAAESEPVRDGASQR